MTSRRAVLTVKREVTPSQLTLADAIGQVAGSAPLTASVAALYRDRRVSLEGLWLGALAPVVAGWLQISSATATLKQGMFFGLPYVVANPVIIALRNLTSLKLHGSGYWFFYQHM